jgi:hypothetical protein
VLTTCGTYPWSFLKQIFRSGQSSYGGDRKILEVRTSADRIYSIEIEIKDTSNTNRSASYLDLHLEIDSEGRLRTKPYNKKHEQVLVGSTGKDDSYLPKAVQVQIPSNVFRHSISEKSVLQLSKRYNRSWYKTPQNRFQII